MSRVEDGPAVVVDLSNLTRDASLPGGRASLGRLALFTAALEQSPIEFSRIYSVADRSLPSLLRPPEKQELREMEKSGVLQFSSLADELILALAFGGEGGSEMLVASLDYFDDFRRGYPEIQGCLDRFIGWEADDDGGVRVMLRDMQVRGHHKLSRKEESSELKARRLRYKALVERAAANFFVCENPFCPLAQLWPERLPELPRFDDRNDCFVCPSCKTPLRVGEPRPSSTQFIVFLDGSEQCRVLLDEGESMVIGRTDSEGCLGLESRLPSGAADAVSRRHLRISRSRTNVKVEDLDSRNGSVVRWLDASHEEVRLVRGAPIAVGRRNVVALPSGITLEISGRSIPLAGERAPSEGDDPVDRSTRILSVGP